MSILLKVRDVSRAVKELEGDLHALDKGAKSSTEDENRIADIVDEYDVFQSGCGAIAEGLGDVKRIIDAKISSALDAQYRNSKSSKLTNSNTKTNKPEMRPQERGDVINRGKDGDAE